MENINTPITKKFILFSSILIFLIPIAQVTGPFFTDLFISLTALFYFVVIIIFNRKLHSNNLILNLLIFFWIYILFFSIISDYKSLSFKPSVTFIRFIIFTYAILFIIQNKKNFLEIFNIFLAITLLIVIIDGYFQFIFGYNIIGLEKLRPDRLSGFFGDELILGSFLSKLFPIVCFLYYHNIKFKKIRILNTLVIVSIIPLIFLSGERSAFFLTLLFSALILPMIFSIKKFLVISFSLIFFGLIIINLNSVIYDRYIIQLVDHVKTTMVLDEKGIWRNIKDPDLINDPNLINYKKETIYFPEHIGLFNSAYNNFLKNKIKGTGVKSFREVCKNNQSNYKMHLLKIKSNLDFCSTHPHNYYLQFLTETGLIGFICLCSFFIYCIFNYLRCSVHFFLNKVNDLNLFQKYIILLSGNIMHLWPLTTTGNFFNNWNSSFIFIHLSLFIYISYEYFNQSKK